MMNSKFTMGASAKFDILRRIARSITSCLDVKGIMDQIVEFTTTHYKPANWSMLLHDMESDELYFEIAIGQASHLLKDIRFNADQGIAGWSMKHSKKLIIREPYKDPRFNSSFDEKSGFKTENIISIPLVSKKRTLGVIELVNVKEEFLESSYIEMLEALADFAAISIENARNHEEIKLLAIKDDCTDLYNSRYMQEIVEEELLLSKESGEHFSIIFFDLDHFKDVNDTYGHLIGSELLRQVSLIILEETGEKDRSVRYGGDEFIVILSGKGKARAMETANRIRSRFNSTLFFQQKGYNISLTASFGVASSPDDASSRDEIIKLADHAMYAVKKHGRDNIFDAGELKLKNLKFMSQGW